ncbi:hypothetical protein [Tropicimonas sp. IMCC6043]|uniref:hypothetical protein n=1 Tax=Tropicimonas sp. IMCC6043 TaxID=2510645 RepID=UPI00101E159C|nr:hypothetical protein [Tropicimonas sp. IMCC6043]RYH09990.1 hypothetical protein EU800_10605 [Tropicimonas sp. IMCC6043]
MTETPPVRRFNIAANAHGGRLKYDALLLAVPGGAATGDPFLRPGPALDGLDGDHTCHWRAMPPLYARECNRVGKAFDEVSASNWIK